MKFLVDEGCDPTIVSGLRALGHDVVWVAEAAPSTSDREILAWGLREQRLIVHHDLDFGELIFRDGLPTYGVILVRIGATQRETRAARVQELVGRYDETQLAWAITKLTAKRIKKTQITPNRPRLSSKISHRDRKSPTQTHKMHIKSALITNLPSFANWRQFAKEFDGEGYCRDNAIRPTAWYAQQVKRHKQTGAWDLSLIELRLLLYLEANKVKYNGGIENRERVESLLDAVSKQVGG
jgi:predicted nuclease of predicted toxin-antitoxin system